MNSEDLKNLIDYIMENNSQKEASYVLRGRKQHKYVEFSLDTRNGAIFAVKFIAPRGDTKSFYCETEEDLQKIYDWLDEEVKE